jgi:hypothetical protein
MVKDCHPSNGTGITPYDTPEPQRRRAANRHAQLVDGAIIPFKRRKSIAARSSTDGQDESPRDAGKSRLFRLSWTPTRQGSTSRRSWLQGIKSIFRSGQSKSSDKPLSHRHNSSVGNILDVQTRMSKSDKLENTNTSSTTQPDAQPPLALLLDGACDELPTSSSSSSRYLNKPLPLNPDEIVRRISSRTPSTSIDRSQVYSDQPQTASTTSTKFSQASSKKDFQNLAKSLTSSKALDMHYPELSPVHEMKLNPNKYDPLKSPKPPFS